jgi:hypothetical protein
MGLWELNEMCSCWEQSTSTSEADPSLWTHCIMFQLILFFWCWPTKRPHVEWNENWQNTWFLSGIRWFEPKLCDIWAWMCQPQNRFFVSNKIIVVVPRKIDLSLTTPPPSLPIKRLFCPTVLELFNWFTLNTISFEAVLGVSPERRLRVARGGK